MAGRRGQASPAKESAVGSNIQIYLSLIAVMVVGAFGIWVFGVDFGFIQFGGQANINLLYAGAAGSILLSYYADVRYIKAVKKFYGAKATLLDYVPYINFIGTLGKYAAWTSWGAMALILIAAVPAFTPVGQFLPMEFLMFNYTTTVFIIIGMMALYTIIRGYHAFVFKRDAEKAYRKYINDDYGSGGGMSAASYVLYFMPIIRMLPIFTDINLINSVRMELEDMRRKEEI